MMATALSVTYLGAVLCYVASSSARAGEVPGVDTASPRLLRLIGVVLLGLGLALAAASGPVAAGILVWLSMGMAAFSLVVIAAPLVDRFVPVTGALALAVALIALWT